MYWEATYRVVTPLFLGGANQNQETELRTSAIKGMLRFWFRAIALPRLHRWTEVQNLENEIFGSTKKQSSFLLTITKQAGLTIIDPGEKWRNRYGLCYLGYGVLDRYGQTIRPYLKNNGVFSIRLLVKKGAPQETAIYLPLTLQALGLFGAMGARSRKGFGSLSLETLTCDGEEIWKAPATIEELVERQKMLMRTIKLDESIEGLPEYTAFSKNSGVWVIGTSKDALDLLNDLGYEMLRYRSYGRKIKDKHLLPDGSEAEQIFVGDHDLMLNFCRGDKINTHPRRMVFGLPHNYFFSDYGKVDISPASKNYGRRASPLFFHIHALNKDNYAAVITLLPATFLPSKEKVTISTGRRNKVFNKVSVDCNVDYRYITDFINRLTFNQIKAVIEP